MAALPVHCFWKMLAIKNKHHQDGFSVWRCEITMKTTTCKKMQVVIIQIGRKSEVLGIF